MHKTKKLYSAKQFRALLKKSGVTAYEVSKKTGIDAITLSNWRNEHYEPKYDKIKKVADYFGVPTTYFYE